VGFNTLQQQIESRSLPAAAQEQQIAIALAPVLIIAHGGGGGGDQNIAPLNTRIDPRQQQPPAVLQTRSAPKLAAAGNPTHRPRGEQTQQLCAYVLYMRATKSQQRQASNVFFSCACISLTCFYIRDLVFRAQNMLIELCCNVQQRLLTQIFLDIIGDDLAYFLEHASLSICMRLFLVL